MGLGLSYEYIKFCDFYKHNFYLNVCPVICSVHVGDICQFKYVYVSDVCSSDSDIVKILMYLFIYLFIYFHSVQ